jgi:hypothetical protein
VSPVTAALASRAQEGRRAALTGLAPDGGISDHDAEDSGNQHKQRCQCD